MTTVQSARGPLDTADLGRTLMHEHVFVLTPDSQRQWSDEWDESEQVANAIVKLNELAAQGISTIADPTVVGLGRYIARIDRIGRGRPEHHRRDRDLHLLRLPHYFAFADPGPSRRASNDPMVDYVRAGYQEGVRKPGYGPRF